MPSAATLRIHALTTFSNSQLAISSLSVIPRGGTHVAFTDTIVVAPVQKWCQARFAAAGCALRSSGGRVRGPIRLSAAACRFWYCFTGSATVSSCYRKEYAGEETEIGRQTCSKRWIRRWRRKPAREERLRNACLKYDWSSFCFFRRLETDNEILAELDRCEVIFFLYLRPPSSQPSYFAKLNRINWTEAQLHMDHVSLTRGTYLTLLSRTRQLSLSWEIRIVNSHSLEHDIPKRGQHSQRGILKTHPAEHRTYEEL